MGRGMHRLARFPLAGIICLLAISLMTPSSHANTSTAVACLDGFALWANSRTQSEALSVAGSGSMISGATHSNGALRISGSNMLIIGPLTYTTSFEDGGDANSYPAPAQAPAADPPISYDIASYRPGGAAAEAARIAGRYFPVSGDLEIAEPATLSGLYYVAGNVRLSASELRGDVTIVAEGQIDVSGSLQQLGPYVDGLFLFANRRAPGAAVIKLAGSASELHGAIYGPEGMVEIAGNDYTIAGRILGDTLKLGGSSLRINFASEYCPGQPTAPSPAAAAYMPGEIVVKLFNPADLAAVAATNGLDPTPVDQFGTRPIFLLRITDGTDPLVKAGQLRPASGSGDPRVEYAEPNYLTQDPESRGSRGSWVIGGESEGSYAGQWAPAMIRLAEAHQRSRGSGVTVAVLDTGVFTQHLALRDQLTRGFDFVDFDDDPSEVGEQTTHPGFGHGTHVAGLVALAAPAARIMPVRVLDEYGKGNIWVLSEGLLYAVERGPDGLPLNGDEPQVVNLSLGTLFPTRLLRDLVAELTCANSDDDDDDDEDCASGKGVIVVAAAGNSGDTTPHYPAAEQVAGVLAVGASTRDDTRAEFSTFGWWVRLAAPGAEIVSTVPGGAYGVWSGASMAAPLAAGVAALVRAADPGLSAADIADRLIATAHPIAGAIPRRLDAAAALGITPAPPASNDNYAVFVPLVQGMAPPSLAPSFLKIKAWR